LGETVSRKGGLEGNSMAFLPLWSVFSQRLFSWAPPKLLLPHCLMVSWMGFYVKSLC